LVDRGTARKPLDGLTGVGSTLVVGV